MISEGSYDTDFAENSSWISVTWSFRNHSGDLLLKKHLLLQLCTISFRILWRIERSKEQHFSEIENFCNIYTTLERH